MVAVRGELPHKDVARAVTLVAPKPEFAYYPGTIWIPSGLRQPEDLRIPLDNFFRRMKVDYRKAAATGAMPRSSRRSWTRGS